MTEAAASVEPTSFEYQRADSWAEAVELLGIWGEEAKVIAGGQSLVPMMNLRLTRPAALIDLGDIGEEGGPRLETGADGEPVVVVPAMTRHATVLSSDLVAEHLPMLREAVSLVGNVRVRNQGTFGGSVAHADPTAEIPLVTAVLGGEVVVLGPDGERTVPAEDFFRTYLTTAAGPDEVVTEVRLPSMARRPWAFAEDVRRFSDFATVAVAVQVRPPAQLRVGLGGVADRPVLIADDVLDPLRNPEPDIITAVAGTIADGIDPEDDVHATGEYRRRLVRVHVRRALERVLTPDDRGAGR